MKQGADGRSPRDQNPTAKERERINQSCQVGRQQCRQCQDGQIAQNASHYGLSLPLCSIRRRAK